MKTLKKGVCQLTGARLKAGDRVRRYLPGTSWEYFVLVQPNDGEVMADLIRLGKDHLVPVIETYGGQS